MKQNDLPTLVRDFFQSYLVAQRGLSEHTVLAYRDTWKLLLQFAARLCRKSCAKLEIADLSAKVIRRFLDYLERDRHNSVPTRNNRLAAIRTFFDFLASTEPRWLAHCQTVLSIRFKRQARRVPEYLERQEVTKIFDQIDGRSPLGQRDDALLRLLYNTGMRAQELVDLDVCHVRFGRPSHVRIRGKGRKERTCPLWPETVRAIRRYLDYRKVRSDELVPLFVNAQGNRLSRFGLRHIIAHRVGEAAKVCPSLFKRKVTPHTWRHTTAMHLLQSHVDLSMIRSWLGHASIETTNTYVEFDLDMKRETLRSAEVLLPRATKRGSAWQRDQDLLAWLSRL